MRIASALLPFYSRMGVGEHPYMRRMLGFTHCYDSKKVYCNVPEYNKTVDRQE